MNYLEQPLFKILEKIETYQGYLNHLNNDLTKYEKVLTDKLSDSEPKFLKRTQLVISDLTGETDNGWEINYASHTPGYNVTSANYNQRNQEIFSIVSLSLTVQIYEAIETYIKEILTTYFINNEDEAKVTIGAINLIKNRGKVDWKSTIQKINKGVNKKGLLRIIKLLSSEFEEAEHNNLNNIDLSAWFEMISIARHCIVHSNSVLKNDQRNKMTPTMEEYLNVFFETRKDSDGSIVLRTESFKQRKLFKFSGEYCFLIFKSLSMSLDLDWKVLQNMNTRNKVR